MRHCAILLYSRAIMNRKREMLILEIHENAAILPQSHRGEVSSALGGVTPSTDCGVSRSCDAGGSCFGESAPSITPAISAASEIRPPLTSDTWRLLQEPFWEVIMKTLK